MAIANNSTTSTSGGIYGWSELWVKLKLRQFLQCLSHSIQFRNCIHANTSRWKVFTHVLLLFLLQLWASCTGRCIRFRQILCTIHQYKFTRQCASIGHTFGFHEALRWMLFRAFWNGIRTKATITSETEWHREYDRRGCRTKWPYWCAKTEQTILSAIVIQGTEKRKGTLMSMCMHVWLCGMFWHVNNNRTRQSMMNQSQSQFPLILLLLLIWLISWCAMLDVCAWCRRCVYADFFHFLKHKSSKEREHHVNKYPQWFLFSFFVFLLPLFESRVLCCCRHCSINIIRKMVMRPAADREKPNYQISWSNAGKQVKLSYSHWNSHRKIKNGKNVNWPWSKRSAAIY